MPFTGRILTEEERVKVTAPFSKNAGQKWDLQTVKEYVRAGADAVAQDSVVSSEINRGIQSLGGNRGASNGEV